MSPEPTISQTELDKARAKQAELIRQVREGVPPRWTPKPGWADRFTDQQIWAAWLQVARDPDVTNTPEMVAVTLVEDVIDGRHR